MLPLILIGIVLSLSAGAAAKLALDISDSKYRITKTEFIIGALICSILVVPATSAAGQQVALQSNLTYHEYWNGFETAAIEEVRQCTRDGSCRNEYRCDPYTVTEHYTNSDGKRRTRNVTKWHQCPVGTEEATYTVETTLGTQTIATGHYTTNTRPWRSSKPLDGPTEPPEQWAAAKARLAAGKPGGVTTVHNYENFLLAAQDTILKKYSAAIETYRNAGLMPAPVKGTTDGFHAPKAYFVGDAPQDTQAWIDAVARVGGALGVLGQGDLHVVLVHSKDVSDPDEYTNALLAYWQSPELGKDSVSKNTVVVVVGTQDGKAVEWARAGTGMPIGNEALITAIRSDLPGTNWTPDALIGDVTATVRGGDIADEDINISPGALTDLLFATDGTGFERACMSCQDDDGGVGYDYLKGQVKVTGAQYVVIGTVAFVLSAMVWAVFVYVGQAPSSPVTRYRNSRRR